MIILKWYSIFVVMLLIISLLMSKGTKSSTIVLGGLMFVPILVYLIYGGV